MPSRALAPVPQPLPSLRVLRAEGRVRALLDEVLALDAEREQLERELAAFSATWEREAGNVLAELDDAERLVRRMRRLQDELAALSAAGGSVGAPRRDAARVAAEARTRVRSSAARDRIGAAARRAAAAYGPGRGRSSAEAHDRVVIEPEELALKRLHRRLARAIHPDLARGESERTQFEDWMARVNSAYHRRDLAALEILAEKIGLGSALDEPSEAERLARLERRALALQTARASTERTLTRLRASEAWRLRRDWERSTSEGSDLAAETRAAAAGRIAAARQEALTLLGACVRSAATLEHAPGGGAERRGRRTSHDRGSAAGPLARSALALAEIGRPGGRARELARELEELAGLPEPWEPALTLLAFFAEAGGRVPETLADPVTLAERWDALRAGWPRSPDLAHALARLPRHLEVGLRHREGSVSVGLQLTTAEGLSAVRHALASGALRPLARRVLAALGPLERCDACDATVSAVHLLRTRGLDEVHGFVCGRCGTVLRSYWHYGDAEGLEALAPLALEVGLVAEAHVVIGRRTVAFQMLPAQRASLSAEHLARLVHALYVQPHALPLQLRHLAFATRGSDDLLAPDAPIPAAQPVRLRLSNAAMREREVVSWLKARIEQRFRR